MHCRWQERCCCTGGRQWRGFCFRRGVTRKWQWWQQVPWTQWQWRRRCSSVLRWQWGGWRWLRRYEKVFMKPGHFYNKPRQNCIKPGQKSHTKNIVSLHVAYKYVLVESAEDDEPVPPTPSLRKRRLKPLLTLHHKPMYPLVEYSS